MLHQMPAIFFFYHLQKVFAQVLSVRHCLCHKYNIYIIAGTQLGAWRHIATTQKYLQMQENQISYEM